LEDDVEFYRCRICGETYLGTKAPSRCPFCGVADDYFVLTTLYIENGAVPVLSDTERTDLLHAIDMERGNARFYRAMSLHRDNPKLASAFKRLANIEAEHCSIFSKLAGVPKPDDLLEPADSSAAWRDNVKESLARELRASTFYAEAAGRARNPRFAEILLAIGAVERDHIELDGIAAQIADATSPGSEAHSASLPLLRSGPTSP
jgi:rubrerythrin